MESTARSREGTTLYLSELSNGLVFTLSIRDVGRGEHEKHVWKTSYPLLELLYPHWIKKQAVNTPVNFLAHALRQAEQAFGWKLVNEVGKFRLPETGFGDGVSSVRVLQSDLVKSPLDEVVSEKSVRIQKRNDISIGKELLGKIDAFNETVVVLVLDFFSYEIIECTPRVVGKSKRWEYKSSKIQYKTKQEFVDMLATKKFLPFVSEHVPEGQMFNTLLNYTYWRPLTTSSPLVKDLFRALITSMLLDLGKYGQLHERSQGHVFVTGELPLFMHDAPRLQLSVIDGLGLAGQWTVTIDEHAQLIPFMVDDQDIDVFRELSAENTSLWIVPIAKKSKSIVTVKIKDVEYRGVYGNLYTYKHHPEIHEMSVTVDAKESTTKVPAPIAVQSVTIDMRTWPVVYGPNTVANSVKIPQWLDRIKKQIKITSS